MTTPASQPRGIGRAIAVALADAGHRVAFCYSSDHDGAKETQAAVEAAGADAFAVPADVADVESVDHAFTEIEGALGPVDVLVNNAGIVAESAEPSRSALTVPSARLREASQATAVGGVA